MFLYCLVMVMVQAVLAYKIIDAVEVTGTDMAQIVAKCIIL